MKSKVRTIGIAMLCVLMFGILIPNLVMADTATTPLHLGITELRTMNTPNLGYAIGDPNTNGVTGMAAKIWNIVKYSTESSNDPTETNFFCVKAGVGFSDTHKKAKYDIFYDMKTQRKEIAAQNEVLKSIVEGNIDAGSGKTVGKYDSLLALSDLLYLAVGGTQEDKIALLNAAGITNEEFGDVMLTEDEIDAVEQAAIWYFTNYGEENNKYDKTSNTGWLNYTKDGSLYTSLGDYNPTGVEPGRSEGRIRQEQAERLYNYLIATAKQNANNYSSSRTLGEPVTFDTKTLNYTVSGNDYILGPIHITEKNKNPYTIDFIVKNAGVEVKDYKLLDENKTDVTNTKTVKDLVNHDFYISLPKEKVTDILISGNINYKTTKLTLWASSSNHQEQPVMIPEIKNEKIPFELQLKPNEKIFDLALRKYITSVNGKVLDGLLSRVPIIDETTLKTGTTATTETTATYKHKKDPVLVKSGDKVIYKLTIYNEGEKAGRATKVVDQLPAGLKFVKVVSGNFDLDSYQETDNTLRLKRKSGNEENLPAYVEGNLASETIEIECEVIAKPDAVDKKVLTNVAWISEEYDAESKMIITNQKEKDRDSEPSTYPIVNKDNMSDYIGNGNKADLMDSDYYYKGQQDDDDFEKLILMPETFDLKLIKRITEVNNQKVPERIESIDASKLNTIGIDGKLVTTADYKLNKIPVGVKKGDIVTYTFRIYNEGTIDGYAQAITEDIPEGLEFIWSEKFGQELKDDNTLTAEEKEAVEYNQKYLWGNFKYDADGKRIIEITTDYLSKEQEGVTGENLIPAFGNNDGTKTDKDLSYKEVSVKLKVIAENISGDIIRNEACISDDANENGDPVEDRDSKPEEWVKYEDDEDFDNIVLQSFDLALRKFIVAVSDDEVIDDNEYLKNQDGTYTRQPKVDTSKLNTKDENGKVITTSIYKHTKEPVIVKYNDIVVYMLRVYNEGDIDGYAAEIKDHLPPYLSFVDSEFNKKYGWTVSEDGRTVTTKYLENEKIAKPAKDANDKYVLTYKEVPIMCKVNENAKTSENITNIADITKYLDENKKDVIDRDSQENNVKLPEDQDLPNYKDDEKGTYVPGQQDDDDFEKVIVKKFDLALRKWVTQAIVIDKNGQTITETGHKPYDDPEQIVKVELHRKKLNEVTVKFRYSIRVINEGEVAGYAKEVTDYIPEGLKFVAEDNPGWVDEGNNVISTRLLENTLLQPGEYADVEVLLTWINNENNLGLKVNTAEISEDENEYNIPDIDSTPDNKKPGEDDIDDAPVMLSISTGRMRIYYTLGFIVLITIAGGIVLIKKYVL